MQHSDIDILVCEVGLRDGLQNAKSIMPTDIKKEWIRAQAASGFREIEVCSFVPPKVVKGMEDAEEVVSFALECENLKVAALAPNFYGAKNAISAGVHKVSLPVSVSEAHSHSNVRKSRSKMIEEVERVCIYRDNLGTGGELQVEVGLATAFGCSIQGKVSERDTVETAIACAEAGANEIVLSDTIGIAVPSQVKKLFKLVRANLGEKVSSLHLHNTYGLGLANVCAAIEAGANSFDSSLGGLGGCPFAPGASGNIVTEDLIYMLEKQGLRTGINLEKLLQCRQILKRGLPEDQLYGYLVEAGLPKTLN